MRRGCDTPVVALPGRSPAGFLTESVAAGPLKLSRFEAGTVRVLGTSRSRCDRALGPVGLTPPHRAAFAPCRTAPDTFHLPHPHGPVEALLHDRATATHGLRSVNLLKCRTTVSYGEEQIRVFMEASCPFAPVHGVIRSFDSHRTGNLHSSGRLRNSAGSPEFDHGLSRP